MREQSVIRTSNERLLRAAKALADRMPTGHLKDFHARQQVIDLREAIAAHGNETYDQRWIREAKGTLDKLYAFLQAKNVPHAVDTREWIDNALRVLNAYEPPAQKANSCQETK